MAFAASSYIPTAAAVLTRNREQCSFSFLPRPQAMTIYIRFIEQGTVLLPAALFGRILHIGDSLTAQNFIMIVGSGSFYRSYYNARGVNAQSTVPVAPNIGDQVELRFTLTSAGVSQLNQSINGAAETSGAAGAAIALPLAWINASAATDELLRLNSIGSVGVGFCAFRNVVVVAGVQSLQAMRSIAGVA